MFQATNAGGTDAFVAKVNPAGSALVYAGFLGGSSNEFGNGIAVDGAGDAYVTGQTYSAAAGFPETAGVFQPANGGGSDVFVARIVSDAAPATCSYTIVAGPPKHIDFTVQDVGSGIASIATLSLTNMVTPVPIPAFTVGTTAPVSFTATKDSQAQRATIAVVITDRAGNQSSCI